MACRAAAGEAFSINIDVGPLLRRGEIATEANRERQHGGAEIGGEVDW